MCDQINLLQYPADSQTVSSIPRCPSETSLQLYTIPSSQSMILPPALLPETHPEEKPADRHTKKCEVKVTLKGCDIQIRATLGADSSIVVVSSEKWLCRGIMNESWNVRI